MKPNFVIQVIQYFNGIKTHGSYDLRLKNKKIIGPYFSEYKYGYTFLDSESLIKEVFKYLLSKNIVDVQFLLKDNFIKIISKHPLDIVVPSLRHGGYYLTYFKMEKIEKCHS